MGWCIQQRCHSRVFTGAQPGVPDVAPVQALGAPSPLPTQEWRPSCIPTLQTEGAQADTCFSALLKGLTAGARLHFLAPTCALARIPAPCTCARPSPGALTQTPAAHQPLLTCRATQCAQFVSFRSDPAPQAKHSMSSANTAMASPHEHRLKSPTPCADTSRFSAPALQDSLTRTRATECLRKDFQPVSKPRPGSPQPSD